MNTFEHHSDISYTVATDDVLMMFAAGYHRSEADDDDDANNNYEDIEAKLQQERIDYLKTLRNRSELHPACSNSKSSISTLFPIKHLSIITPSPLIDNI